MTHDNVNAYEANNKGYIDAKQVTIYRVYGAIGPSKDQANMGHKASD